MSEENTLEQTLQDLFDEMDELVEELNNLSIWRKEK